MPKSQTHRSYYKDCRFFSRQRAASAAHLMQSHPEGLAAYVEKAEQGNTEWHKPHPAAGWSDLSTPPQQPVLDFRPLRPLLIMWAFPWEITSPEAQIRSDAEGRFKPWSYTHTGITLFQLFGLKRFNEAISVLKAKQSLQITKVPKFAGPRSGFLPWGKKLLILPLVFLEK